MSYVNVLIIMCSLTLKEAESVLLVHISILVTSSHASNTRSVGPGLDKHYQHIRVEKGLCKASRFNLWILWVGQEKTPPQNLKGCCKSV